MGPDAEHDEVGSGFLRETEDLLAGLAEPEMGANGDTATVRRQGEEGRRTRATRMASPAGSGATWRKPGAGGVSR